MRLTEEEDAGEQLRPSTFHKPGGAHLFPQQHARNQTSRIINSFLSGGRSQARIITKQLSAGVGNFSLHLFDCRFHLIPRALYQFANCCLQKPHDTAVLICRNTRHRRLSPMQMIALLSICASAQSHRIFVARFPSRGC